MVNITTTPAISIVHPSLRLKKRKGGTFCAGAVF
jgi:hypothetical protein